MFSNYAQRDECIISRFSQLLKTRYYDIFVKASSPLWEFNSAPPASLSSDNTSKLSLIHREKRLLTYNSQTVPQTCRYVVEVAFGKELIGVFGHSEVRLVGLWITCFGQREFALNKGPFTEELEIHSTEGWMWEIFKRNAMKGVTQQSVTRAKITPKVWKNNVRR